MPLDYPYVVGNTREDLCGILDFVGLSSREAFILEAYDRRAGCGDGDFNLLVNHAGTWTLVIQTRYDMAVLTQQLQAAALAVDVMDDVTWVDREFAPPE